MNEDKIMILLGVWSNIIATISLAVTIRQAKKKPSRKPNKHKRKR